jgi:uncharacterized protein (TIGR03086 family)
VSDREIVITREFAAPRQRVFDAHTRPELLRRWFGPHGWRLVVCEVDLRPGGAWHHVLRGPDDEEMVLRGTYLEVDPPHRLVTTETNVDCHARAEHEAVLTLEFTGDTVLTHTARFPTAGIRDAVLESGMARGVGEGFDRLADTLDIAGRYRRRAADFARTVAAVRRDQWDLPSPCAGWTVRDVVGHVVEMHGVLLRSAGREPAAPGGEPLADFRAASAAIQAVLADPVTARREFVAPHAGRTTVEVSIDEVISGDLVLHGWDLARATGQDDTIDPAEVAAAVAAVERLPEEVRRLPHVFGPPVPVADDAAPQDRMLALIGRDPRWRN